MVRKYKRKAAKKRDENNQRRSIGMSVRAASRESGIPQTNSSTHQRPNGSPQEEAPAEPAEIVMPPHEMALTIEQENVLEEYIVYASDTFYGLTVTHGRSLAYEFAVKIGANIEPTWRADGLAGTDWFRGFMRRHPKLSFRKPEGAIASAFSRANVARFFENYRKATANIHFPPFHIWNVDECGVSTAHNAVRVISRCGSKCGQNERGRLVSVFLTINATGMRMPPHFVFPRAKFQPHFLNLGPAGCTGGAHPTGWITTEVFLDFLKAFQAHTRCRAGHPVLLLLDNHQAHRSLAVIDFCRANGIHLLSFPPHCAQRLQPLDVAVFGAFKSAMNIHFANFMQTNPGRTISIFDVPHLVNKALLLDPMEKYVLAGFERSGVYPVNWEPFSELDFMVGDRAVSGELETAGEEFDVLENEAVVALEHMQEVEKMPQPQPIAPATLRATLESIRPYSKAPAGKVRKTLESTIRTADMSRCSVGDDEIKKQNKTAKKAAEKQAAVMSSKSAAAPSSAMRSKKTPIKRMSTVNPAQPSTSGAKSPPTKRSTRAINTPLNNTVPSDSEESE